MEQEKLIYMTLKEFSEKVNSDAPTPGGGSVAAYVSNLGAALLGMMGYLTKNKKKFEELDLDTKETYKENFNELQYIYDKLLLRVDTDKEYFDKLMSAYKTPPRDNRLIQKLTEEAADEPLDVAKLSYKALKLSITFVENANNHVISDLIGGMYLLEAGINCSLLNVRINANALDDKDTKDNLHKQANQLQKEARRIIDDYTRKIEQNRL